MKNRIVAILLLFALAAAGCQGNPQVRRVVDSVQAEARQMEDMIYLLEQDIQVLEQENAKLKRQVERGGDPTGSSGTRGRIAPRNEDDLNPPVVEPPPGEMPDLPPARPSAPRPLNRSMRPTEPDIGPVLDPPAKKVAKGPAGKIKPTGHEQSITTEATEPEVTDKNVTHIHLNPLHTCGMDFDHAPGDDGLSILIEPRNGANQFVPLACPVSVVVLDPSKNGDDARVARWDFSQAQTAEKLQQGDLRGIHLKLPWPAKPPENVRLEVFVRYETPAGKKLQAEKEIFATLPGQYSQRWTPRPAERQRKKPSEALVAETNEPRIAAAPPPLTAIESPAEKKPAEKSPRLNAPPAGLSERQPGEKPAKPKWAPTR
jgi:hypothetical protein